MANLDKNYKKSMKDDVPREDGSATLGHGKAENQSFGKNSKDRKKKREYRDVVESYQTTLIKWVPWFAAGTFVICFVTPFAFRWLKISGSAFENLNEVFFVSFNVPLFGVAGALIVSFMRAASANIKTD